MIEMRSTHGNKEDTTMVIAGNPIGTSFRCTDRAEAREDDDGHHGGLFSLWRIYRCYDYIPLFDSYGTRVSLSRQEVPVGLKYSKLSQMSHMYLFVPDLVTMAMVGVVVYI